MARIFLGKSISGYRRGTLRTRSRGSIAAKGNEGIAGPQELTAEGIPLGTVDLEIRCSSLENCCYCSCYYPHVQTPAAC